tara:strand:+ start:57 stop:464 length:408 start_codon:yes stop_codon:yes gene_type:complete
MDYFSKPFLIRYCETDKMGFVHHSNFLKYLEIARLEWLKKKGVSYLEMEKNGIIMPLVDAKIKYIHPAYFDDLIKIRVKLEKSPVVKMELSYIVINQDDKILCKASTTLCFLNSKTLKPFRCPKFLIDAFKNKIT